MKNLIRVSILLVLLAASYVSASGIVGIYAVVSKVVFEPNDKTPERIQIWGAFTLVDGGIASNGATLTPQRGYLYFTLSGKESQAEKEAVSKEWADFKSIAGTGQAIAFGRFGYIGNFSDELIFEGRTGTRSYVSMPGNPANISCPVAHPVRAESAAPASPCSYPLNTGLTKLSATGSLGAIVKKLQDALVR